MKLRRDEDGPEDLLQHFGDLGDDGLKPPAPGAHRIGDIIQSGPVHIGKKVNLLITVKEHHMRR